jgi:hypothetical protein
MRNGDLTQEQRNAMTEDELVAHDLGHLKRRPGLAAGEESLLRERIRRERGAQAELEGYARDRKLAGEHGTTVDAIRRVRAEAKAAGELAGAHRALHTRQDTAYGGLTRDQIVDTTAELWEDPKKPAPTQPVVSEKLGRDDRRIRQVQGPGKWPGILADARAKLERK